VIFFVLVISDWIFPSFLSNIYLWKCSWIVKYYSDKTALTCLQLTTIYRDNRKQPPIKWLQILNFPALDLDLPGRPREDCTGFLFESGKEVSRWRSRSRSTRSRKWWLCPSTVERFRLRNIQNLYIEKKTQKINFLSNQILCLSMYL
jgi:hypothetical protein